jgi:hypothetical protein
MCFLIVMFGSPNRTKRTWSPSFAATANFLPPSESRRGWLYPLKTSPAILMATGWSHASPQSTKGKHKINLKTKFTDSLHEDSC